MSHGVEDRMFDLITHYFNTTFIINLHEAIDMGHPVIGLITNPYGMSHEVLITGYFDNGLIEYFDPALGGYYANGESTFDELFEISGVKN